MRPDRGEALWILIGLTLIWHDYWILGVFAIWFALASIDGII